MKRLPLLLLCALSAGGQAQVLSNPDQATLNRLGLVFAPVQALAADSGTTVSARVITSPQQADAIIARFAGVMEEWLVAPGDAVTAGAVLGRIRSTEVLDLQQRYLEADAALQQATTARTRDQKLLEDGVIAAQRVQQTEREYQAARATANALGEQLTQAGLDAEVRGRLASQSSMLGVYTLRAPHDGVVGRLHVRVGEAVEGSMRLAELSASSLWVEADLPLALALTLEEGQTLRTTAVATPLVLRQLDRQVDPRTQTIGLRAEFEGPVELRSGQIVPLVLTPKSSGWLIPADAVVHNGGDTAVFVRTAAGIESRDVQLQPLGADYMAQEGFTGNEQLVVRGAALLKGMTLGLGGE